MHSSRSSWTAARPATRTASALTITPPTRLPLYLLPQHQRPALEYRPGSTIFVVWQQGREENLEGQGSLRFGRDFGHVFSAPACNTFLVKFAYWFNY